MCSTERPASFLLHQLVELRIAECTVYQDTVHLLESIGFSELLLVVGLNGTEAIQSNHR